MDPERRRMVLAVLWRWRETLAGFGLAAAGLWLALSGFGLSQVLGWGTAAAGAFAALAGAQRARFRSGAEGPGIVVLREAELTYFGPESGGVVNIGSLVRIELDGSPGSAGAVWLLTEEGRAPLAVPVSAGNAEALFDAFAALPGIRTGRMLDLLQRPPGARVLVWEREPAARRLTLPR